MTFRIAFLSFAAFLAVAPQPASAEFLAPDLNTIAIQGIAPPDWIAGGRDGAFIGMCGSCEGGTVLLQIQVLDDDGTGRRVRSGETTAETYTALGRANAEKLGGESDYIGTEPISFGPAVGFRTKARIATGDYSVTHQLWSDGKQLLVKVYGPDESVVDRTAETAYTAAAPLTFR